MEIVPHRVVDEAACLFLWLAGLVLEDHIVVPPVDAQEEGVWRAQLRQRAPLSSPGSRTCVQQAGREPPFHGETSAPGRAGSRRIEERVALQD